MATLPGKVELVKMLQGILAKPYRAFGALRTRSVLLQCDSIPYRFENVPIKKLLNWLRVGASFYAKPERPWGWPTHLQLEPTTYCNLRCALCPTTGGLDRPTGHMPPALFEKLIDEVGEYLFLILFWDWGEPFLNPHIYEMIGYARQRGIKTVSSSNGHVFAQAKHAEQVVRSGLDTLIFAMDGVTQESYERYRQGGKLETVLQGIREVVAQKRALNSKTPLVNLRFIVMGHNEREIPTLKELARSLGVDALTLKTLNCYSVDVYGENREANGESYQSFLPKDPRYQRFSRDTATHARILLKHNPCKNLWNAPTIHWNGAVCPCTYDHDEKYVLGDLKATGFGEIWSGAAYRRMRRNFCTDWERHPICGDCSYAYKGGNCVDETIAEALFFDR